MKLKRFEALTLQGALQSVKAELGPDAVIVSTRRVNKGGGLFGLLSQPVVEVTAAIDRAKKQQKVPASILERVRQAEQLSETPIAHPTSPEVSPPVVDRSESFDAQLRVATMLDPVAQQLTELKEELQRLREERDNPEAVVGPLRQELEGLRIIVGEALGDRMRQRVDALPGDLCSQYEALIAQGVQPQIAHSLLRSIVETLGTGGIGNRTVVNQLLRERLEDTISVSGSMLPKDHLKKVVMLVGPTGVGKTTTVAKLASLATQANRPCKTVLITLDTYRVAAVEQLRVFAKILKLPLEVAVSPNDLTTAIGRHQQADLILIDTAGRSPRDRTGQDELAAIARQNLNIETHLVLAAPTTESILHDVIQQYRTIPIHRLLFTKLDEVSHVGKLFNLLHYTGLPLSYFSMGQRVPEDLELATTQRVVELLDVLKNEDSREQVESLGVPA